MALISFYLTSQMALCLQSFPKLYKVKLRYELDGQACGPRRVSTGLYGGVRVNFLHSAWGGKQAFVSKCDELRDERTQARSQPVPQDEAEGRPVWVWPVETGGDSLLETRGGLLFSTQEPLARVLHADLLPASLPPLIADGIA
jgi:hypothetical protein